MNINTDAKRQFGNICLQNRTSACESVSYCPHFAINSGSARICNFRRTNVSGHEAVNAVPIFLKMVTMISMKDFRLSCATDVPRCSFPFQLTFVLPVSVLPSLCVCAQTRHTSTADMLSCVHCHRLEFRNFAAVHRCRAMRTLELHAVPGR